MSYEKLTKKNDMEYLYELVKFFPPKRKLEFQQIKSEEDIKEEIIKFIKKYDKSDKSDKSPNNEQKEKEEEEEEEKILKNKELKKLFKSIFFYENKLNKLLINENNKSKYIEKRVDQEKKKKKQMKNSINNLTNIVVVMEQELKNYF